MSELELVPAFDDAREARIERAARAICIANGLDPDARVGGGCTTGLTQGEILVQYPHGRIPMIAVDSPQWRHFRPAAIGILAVIDAESPPVSGALRDLITRRVADEGAR